MKHFSCEIFIIVWMKLVQLLYFDTLHKYRKATPFTKIASRYRIGFINLHQSDWSIPIPPIPCIILESDHPTSEGSRYTGQHCTKPLTLCHKHELKTQRVQQNAEQWSLKLILLLTMLITALQRCFKQSCTEHVTYVDPASEAELSDFRHFLHFRKFQLHYSQNQNYIWCKCRVSRPQIHWAAT